MRCWGWAGLILVVVGLTGCGGDAPGSGDRSTVPPRLGAPAPTPSQAPSEPMDHLEQPIAERLAPRLEDDGLTLEYVACPPWTGELPSTLTCSGYVDGVVGQVKVELGRAPDDSVEFDATLRGGVVATRRLVHRLRQEGYSDADCGSTPAYPARMGMRIICRVQEDGETTYVVATVTGQDGEVRIEEY